MFHLESGERECKRDDSDQARDKDAGAWKYETMSLGDNNQLQRRLASLWTNTMLNFRSHFVPRLQACHQVGRWAAGRFASVSLCVANHAEVA